MLSQIKTVIGTKIRTWVYSRGGGDCPQLSDFDISHSLYNASCNDAVSVGDKLVYM